VITDRMVEAAFEKLKLWLLDSPAGRERIRAALAAADAAAWEGIESAPRDGTRVLVRQDGETAVAGWMTAIEDGSGEWIIWRRFGSDAMAIRMLAPTHWRPLPAPPVQS